MPQRILTTIFCGWMLWLAASGALAAPPETILMGDDDRPRPLGAYLRLLGDEGGKLGLSEVMAADAAGRFEPLPSPAPGLGFRRGAVWIRFTIANPSPRPLERWLQSVFFFQQSYILYLVDPSGGIQRMESGSQVPIENRPLYSRQVLFPIRLEPGESRTGYLRISGRAATVLDFQLWEPAALFDRKTQSLTLKYWSIGATSIVLVFGFLNWRVRRRPGLLAIIPAHMASMFLALGLDGFIANWIPLDARFWLTRTTFLLIAALLYFHVVFARAFLELDFRAPRSDRFLAYLGILCLIDGAMAIIDVPPTALHLTSLTIIVSLTAVAILNAGARATPGRTYLLAWGGLWVAFIIRLIQQLGLLPGTVFLFDLHILGLLISGFAMAYALYLDVESIRREVRSTQAELLARELGETERLSKAVKQRTEELRRAIERAESSSRAKSVFLSTVSHEFRTPLHTILGYAELLAKQVDSGLASKLAVIGRSGTQLLRLIDEVLDYSRGESQPVKIHPAPFHLGALARHLEETGSLLAGKNGNRFSLEFDPKLPTSLEGGEKRLTQILLNLIDNACKYTRFGRVSVRIVQDQPPESDADGRRRHFIHFEVTDTGVGIPASDRPAIFEPFNRGADGKYLPGVGLGLAITRQLVEAMGGKIDFESEPGQGSRFFFTLSLLEADTPAPEIEHPRGRIVGYLGRKLTLLIADDIAENREYFSDVFNAWGITALAARDGDEAIQHCLRADPPIDAVLVDQFMPRRNGWELLRTIRETSATARLPVILVSAAQPQRPADFPPEMRFDAVLLKPVSPSRIAEVLQPLLHIEWVLDAAEPGRSAAPPDGVTLPPERTEEFRVLLDQGRVVRLRRWAENLASADPDLADFAMRVRDAAAGADLDTLRDLLRQASPASGEEVRG